MKQETLDAIRAWLDGERVQGKCMEGFWSDIMRVEDASVQTFSDNTQYRVLHSATSIVEYDVHAPMTEAPKLGVRYYIPVIHDATYPWSLPDIWDGTPVDIKRLKRGQVHLTEEAALQHAKAVIAISGGKI